MKTNAIISEIIAFILILLWGFVGVTKMLDHETFSRQLYAEGIGENLSGVLSILIPLLMICTGISLISSKTKSVGLILSFSLLMTFTVYMAYIINFANPRPCSCIAMTSKLSWNGHLLLSTSLLILNVVGYIFLNKERRTKTFDISS